MEQQDRINFQIKQNWYGEKTYMVTPSLLLTMHAGSCNTYLSLICIITLFKNILEFIYEIFTKSGTSYHHWWRSNWL